jgi:magnesium-transporting ATPase (P-type)
MQPIPAILSLALAAFASFASHTLRGDNLPRWENMLFAGAAFVLAALGAFWLLGGFEAGGSARQIVLAFLTLAAALAFKELYALLNYIQSAKSPLTKKLPPKSAK